MGAEGHVLQVFGWQAVEVEEGMFEVPCGGEDGVLKALSYVRPLGLVHGGSLQWDMVVVSRATQRLGRVPSGSIVPQSTRRQLARPLSS
jgi:hypothetical protein